MAESGDAKIVKTAVKDGGDSWVVYTTIENQTDGELTLTLREWPHGGDEGDYTKRNPEPTVNNPDDKSVKVKVPPKGKNKDSGQVTQPLAFSKKLGKIKGLYTWLYWEDSRGYDETIWDRVKWYGDKGYGVQIGGDWDSPTLTPPTVPLESLTTPRVRDHGMELQDRLLGHSDSSLVVVDDVYRRVWPTPIPTRFPAGNDNAIIVPFPAIYPRKAFLYAWPERLEFAVVAVDGVPHGWAIQLLYPTLHSRFSPDPLSRSSEGAMRLRYPHGLKEGTRVVLRIVQEAVNWPGDRRFQVTPEVRLVVDHQGPEIAEETVSVVAGTNALHCSVRARDEVSGVAGCAVVISTDAQLGKVRSDLLFDDRSLGQEYERYEGRVGPFPAGCEIDVQFELTDGVGNKSLGRVHRLWMTSVIFVGAARIGNGVGGRASPDRVESAGDAIGLGCSPDGDACVPPTAVSGVGAPSIAADSRFGLVTPHTGTGALHGELTEEEGAHDSE